MTVVLDSPTLAPKLESLPAVVVTVTPSPVFDRVYTVDTMEPGGVHRARSVETFLSGKGINVARALRKAGGSAIAVTAMHDEDLRFVEGDSLYRVVPVAHRSRVNTVVISRDGGTTNLNEAPQSLTTREWAAVASTAADAVDRERADWLVIAGSLPGVVDGGPLDHAVGLAAAARQGGARLCLDSGGDALRAWLAAGIVPDLIKPNLAELADAVGRELTDVGDVVTAARELIRQGPSMVLASLGADGAVLVTEKFKLWAKPPSVRVVNTTGAGDSTVAGFVGSLAGELRPSDFARALRRAVTWGAHAVRTVDTVPGTFTELAGVELGPPPMSRPIHVNA